MVGLPVGYVSTNNDKFNDGFRAKAPSKRAIVPPESRFPAPLLNRKQVAELLGVHVKTVARYEREGQLKSLRLNRRVIRYRPEAVEDYLSKA